MASPSLPPLGNRHLETALKSSTRVLKIASGVEREGFIDSDGSSGVKLSILAWYSLILVPDFSELQQIPVRVLD